jgi:hypothetical protein
LYENDRLIVKNLVKILFIFLSSITDCLLLGHLSLDAGKKTTLYGCDTPLSLGSTHIHSQTASKNNPGKKDIADLLEYVYYKIS